MAQFQAGNPGKPKGAKNKKITRVRISDFLENNWDRFLKELSTLKGRAYVEAVIKMLPYDTPAFTAINMNLSSMSEEDLQILAEKVKELYAQQQTSID